MLHYYYFKKEEEEEEKKLDKNLKAYASSFLSIIKNTAVVSITIELCVCCSWVKTNVPSDL